ncbi:MAG: hypothetical protein GY941_12060 [Planctomycetes bacterium]|nr:hypothetical protein [Planctomycetota bacterium]
MFKEILLSRPMMRAVICLKVFNGKRIALMPGSSDQHVTRKIFIAELGFFRMGIRYGGQILWFMRVPAMKETAGLGAPRSLNIGIMSRIGKSSTHIADSFVLR